MYTTSYPLRWESKVFTIVRACHLGLLVPQGAGSRLHGGYHQRKGGGLFGVIHVKPLFLVVAITVPLAFGREAGDINGMRQRGVCPAFRYHAHIPRVCDRRPLALEGVSSRVCGT